MSDQFGNLQIIRKIGEGGMAAVYLVSINNSSQKFAIKILNRRLTSNKILQDRFQREGITQLRLHHPNIIRCYDLNKLNGYIYLVMEYVSGPNLHQVISHSTGPIPAEFAIPWFCQLLSAMSYAHREGVIHRDLKPSNILVKDFSGRIKGNEVLKIGDFGIAKIIGRDGHTEAGAKLGTLFYMSPEQIKDSKTIDQRTDIYSLGIILFQMLCGRLPFRDTSNEYSIMGQIVNMPLPDPRTFYPHVPEQLVNVIYKASQKEARHRYKSCEELAAALDFHDI